MFDIRTGRHATTHTQVSRKRRLTAVSLAAFLVVVAACGSDDSSSDSSAADDTASTEGAATEAPADTEATDDTASTEDAATDDTEAPAATEAPADTEAPAGTDAEGGSGDIVADAQANYDNLVDGTWGEPPAEGPPLFEGAKIMHLSCGEALPSCSEPSAFVVATGELMGWQVDLRDLNFNPASAGDMIEEAIASGYDAVTMEAVDCPQVQPALQSAIDAGMPVVTFYAHDCTTPTVGGESLMTETQQSEPWEGQWFQDEAWGASKADWLIAEQEGDVKVIQMVQEDVLTPRHIGIGFNDRIAECDTCEVVDTIQFTLADLGDGTFGQKVAQSLSAYPDATSIHFLYDGLLLLGGAQALADTGRSGEITVVGGEFTSVNAELFEQGVENLIMFYDHKWTSYAALDTVNRLLNGEEPVNQGQGWEAVDVDNPPEVEDDGRFRAPVDYESVYAKSWGLDQ